MYPWATEDTVVRLAQLARSNNIKSAALAAAIAQTTNSADVKRIDRLIKDSAKEITTVRQKTEKASKEIKGMLKDAGGSMSRTEGIQALADLGYAGSQAAHRVAESIAEAGEGFGGVVGKFADLIGRGGTAVTGAAVAVTGIGTVFAALIVEQEKTLRSMIELGLIMGDVGMYTDLRRRASEMGMSLNDYVGLIGVTKTMMTNITGDTVTGQRDITNFLSAATDNPALNKFGMMPAQYAAALAQEADMLFRINRINALDPFSQNTIIDSFDTVNRMALFMADRLGIDRQQALELRRQTIQNENFQTALIAQTDRLNESFGDAAADNVRESTAMVTSLLTAIDENFAEQFRSGIASGLMGIAFDTSIENDISREFLETLDNISPQVRNAVTELMEEIMTGQVDAQQAMVRSSEIMNLIKDAPSRTTYSEAGLRAYEIRARVYQLPEEMLQVSELSIDEFYAAIDQAIDNADDQIQTVGNLAVTFLQIQDSITPGFETMKTSLDMIFDAASVFGDAWVTIFGDNDGVFRRPEDRERAIAEYTRLYGAGGYYTGSRAGGGAAGAYTSRVDSAQQRVRDQEMLIERLERDYAAALSAQDDNEMERLEREYETANQDLQRLQQELLDIQASIVEVSNQLGSLSAQYESRGDPTTVADNQGDRGGASYGTYQIASETGAMQGYLNFLQTAHPEIFRQLSAAGGDQAARRKDPRFVEAWQSIMSDPVAAQTQHDYILASYFLPIVDNIQEATGIDVLERSRAVQDVLWSTSVQHGTAGAITVWRNAMSRLGSNPTDEEIIRAIYAERGAENGMRYFSGSSANIRQSVVNRFPREMADAISMLSTELASAQEAALPSDTPTPTVSVLQDQQARLESQIANLQTEIQEDDDLGQSDLSELRSNIADLERQLATVTEQLNTELENQRTGEAVR
jgi:gas vesicle protein